MIQLIPAWVDGVPTPVEKLDAHRRGLRHKAVSVFLIADGKLLLQRRALGKYHTPGLWANACCTHPYWNETAVDCAHRRLREELGLSGVPLTQRHRVEYRAAVGGGLTEHELVDIFVGNLKAPGPLSPDPAEVMETRWTSASSLHAALADNPEAFTPWLKIYMADHAAEILGDMALSAPRS